MKKSQYTNIIREKSTHLVHHALYGGIIKVSDKESKQFIDMIASSEHFEIDESDELCQALIDMKMIVEDELDEENLVNYFYSKIQKQTLQIIPFVTNQCNFRCAYCYEDHKPIRMSKEIYDQMLSGIEYLLDKNGYKNLEISFFGGEPMLEYDLICYFCDKLIDMSKKRNINFYASMTTNGYLLTPDKMQNLITKHVRNYMITVDGLKETHDKQRPLVGNKGSWDIVINNLLGAKKICAPFSLVIRTNFSEEMQKDATNYLHFLADNFNDDKRFKYHFESVKKLGGKNDEKMEVIDNEAAAMYEIIKLAQSVGLNNEAFQSFIDPFGLVCYAAKSDCLAINSDGTLMKCTVCIESERNHIGSLHDGKFDFNNCKMAAWTSPYINDTCKKCNILPICYNRKCPAMGFQPSERCDQYKAFYENTLKALYL